MERLDTVIIGAGVAGTSCAAQTGQAGSRILFIDNGKKPGRRILMSSGGHCSFINLYVRSATYLGQNPHFCKSALVHYTQWDFIDLVSKHGIAWHEKTLGQPFCNDSAQQIVDILIGEREKGNITMRLQNKVLSVVQDDKGFTLELSGTTVGTKGLIVASDGPSIPGLGVTPFSYKTAEQFGLGALPTHAGLVPSMLYKPLPEQFQVLSSMSVSPVITAEDNTVFREDPLFTHRRLSDPVVLQISSLQQPGKSVDINLLPDVDLASFLDEQRGVHPNQSSKDTLAMQLPRRLVECLQQLGQIPNVFLKWFNVRGQQTLVETLTEWRVQSNGIEGYRTAEVTLGGVGINELSSHTMEARKVPELYFIGEMVDAIG